MSRRNGIFWSKEGEMGVGKMGVGKQVPIPPKEGGLVCLCAKECPHHITYVILTTVRASESKMQTEAYSYLV